jgi:hypothetical protein
MKKGLHRSRRDFLIGGAALAAAGAPGVAAAGDGSFVVDPARRTTLEVVGTD